ncbi:uncharacterized protein LOC118747013 [Rhagoletis pomonella]|uniref:uncharacterized protein LOC118747013 n=1 Tax=Rhagoletis pomonella TaxID=28610 RepID=UPI00178643B3|nr:uncharacterized protein LOC118747013 [Rhagoletis pomonella]
MASMYLAHDKEVPTTCIKDLVASTREALILGGDANAHHHTWGSSDDNERGESLFDFILSSKLVIANRGNDPTFITKSRREVLDVTLISENAECLVGKWKVLEEHSFSDHRYIQFEVLGETPKQDRTCTVHKKVQNPPIDNTKAGTDHTKIKRIR